MLRWQDLGLLPITLAVQGRQTIKLKIAKMLKFSTTLGSKILWESNGLHITALLMKVLNTKKQLEMIILRSVRKKNERKRKKMAITLKSAAA